MDMEGRSSQMHNAAAPVEANRTSATNQASQLPSVNLEASSASQSQQLPNISPVDMVRPSYSLSVETNHTTQSVNGVPLEARGASQVHADQNDALRSINMMPTEATRASKSLNMMPARASQLLLVPAETSNEDVQTIKEVLSVHHVPVVASLHWEKLHTMLHTLCDRIAIQAFRLEKAEEQGKTFLGFKEELEQLCKNCVKDMKEAKEREAEQQQKWSSMVEERLQTLQQGLSS